MSHDVQGNVFVGLQVKIICRRTIYIAAQPVQGSLAHTLQIFQSHRNLYPILDDVAG